MVVDDDPVVRAGFVDILRGAGHPTREAEDGKQALLELRRSAADLVLMDIFMPEQEGIETIRRIKEEFASTKIIAISGSIDHTFLDVANWLGADAILSKPVSSQQLLGTLGHVLGNPQSGKV